MGIDLQKWIELNPEILLNKKKLKSVFNDFLLGDFSKINPIFMAYDAGIVESLRAIYPWTLSEKNKYIKILKSQYTIVESSANDAVSFWERLFNQKLINLLLKVETTKNKVDIKEQPKIELKKSVFKDEIGTKKDIEEYYVNPNFIESQERIFIPCGFGNTDNGFYIYGINKQDICFHPQASIFALVYNYLIRLSTITDDDLPRYFYEKESTFGFDYSNIFKLSIVLLQLIKNNYIKNDVLPLNYIGDKNILRFALGMLNNYVALFCRLANIPQIKINVKLSSVGVELNLNGSNGIYVRKNLDIVSNARELWYGQRISYKLDKKNKEDLEYILSEISPYDYFREGQFETICDMAYSRKHMVCIMPTGSGKSLIYYFVSLLQPLPLFVIAPTDILIEDQIRNLRKTHRIDNVAHLRLDAKNNYNNFDEYEVHNSLNYLTPTTLQNRNLLVTFRYLNNGSIRCYRRTETNERWLTQKNISNSPLLANIVLDEIHCISNWGHDFRPEYLMLSKSLNKFLDRITFLGFTATANYTVVEDVQQQLNIPETNFLSPLAFEKHNIKYDFRGLNSSDEMLNEVKKICDSLVAKNERTIVFTKNDDISLKVVEAIGYEADVFTADNPKAYHLFAEGKCKILVTNEELGVGINLPLINNVIHFGLPLSKSEYVQEVGRAGRANEQVCSYVLFLNPNCGVIPINLFRRDTKIETIPKMLTGLDNDYAYVYNKLTNGFPSKEVLYKNLIEYKDCLAKNPIHCICYSNNELLLKKQQLYMLYVAGFVNDWYAAKRDEKGKGIVLLIDIYSSDYDKYEEDPSLLKKRMQERLIDYFRMMGNDRESLARTNRASTVEDLIKIYIDWYYLKYLYHQNEQFLDLFEFITNNVSSEDDKLTESIKDYFSLPFVRLKTDEAIYTDLSIQQITDKIITGINRRTIVNIERINSNRYSYKLDYMLFISYLKYSNNIEFGRLDRLLNHVSKDELQMIINSFSKIYHVGSLSNKLKFLNYLRNNQNKYGIIIEDFMRQIYKNQKKDAIYYGIVAERLNPIFEGV